MTLDKFYHQWLCCYTADDKLQSGGVRKSLGKILGRSSFFLKHETWHKITSQSKGCSVHDVSETQARRPLVFYGTHFFVPHLRADDHPVHYKSFACNLFPLRERC